MNRTVATGSTLGSLLALSVILRVVFPSGLISTVPVVSGQAASTASADTSDQKPTNDGPWKASQGYFAFACGPKSHAGQPEFLARRLATWCIPEDTHVLGLIAIAPDPVRTQMALTFDRTLESVELAAQAAGYVIDRYWLPWSVNTTTSSATVTTGQSGSANNAQPAAESRSAQPGLVLLRRDASPDSPDPSLLFVFLVADLPTGGIDGRQFKLAVQYIDEVCGPQSTRATADGPPNIQPSGAVSGCASDPIRVIGPTFSGSLASLRRLVDQINHRDPQISGPREFRVYSGSVSGLCALHDQGLQPAPPASCQDSSPYNAAPNITFKTFVHDSESAIDHFVEALQTSGAITCGDADVAILSEAATTFGSVTLNMAKTTSGEQEAKCGPTAQTFVFPREISNLRNASSATSTVTTTTVSADNTTAAKPFLTLDLTDRTNSSDAPPDFSPKQGPLSKEAVLMSYAAELRRARYRYIGVLASNVLDSLYVANFLRAACPDARLFMISSDLLFAREFDNVPYVGMLSVTTYPLISPNLKWTSASGRSQLPFGDEYEAAGYNATLEAIGDLLHRDFELNQVRPPFSGPPTGPAPQKFPLWMTVVGSDGYWPVRLLDHGDDTSAVGMSLKWNDLSGSWRVILLMLCGLTALHVGVLLTASPFDVRFRDFAPVGAVPRQRQFYIQTASAVLMLGLGLILMPAWRYPTETLGLNALGTAAMIAVGLAALLLEGLYCLRWRWTKARSVETSDTTLRALITQVLTFAGVWGLTGYLLFLWWTLLGPDRTSTVESLYGFFFAYRVVHPVTGVSPLPPMIPLLVTIYAWACFEIWRLRFNDGMRPRLIPNLSQARGLKQPRPGELSEQKIADAVNRYLLRPPYLVPFATVYLIWLAFFQPARPFELFEQSNFGWLYEVLFCLVVALMLSAAFRMTQIWIDLRRLLVELERRPVRAAFSRVKGMTWSFWRQGGETAEWDQMARSLEALGQLGSGGQPQESGLPPVVFFRRKMRSAQRTIRDLKHQAAKAFDAKALGLQIAVLKNDMAAVASVLASGDANPFFQSAIGEVQRAIESCLAEVTTEERESLRSGLDALSAKLDQAVATLKMLSTSTLTQRRVKYISETWRGLQHRRPLLSAVDSLKEYARAGDRPAGQPDARIALHDRLETGFRNLQRALAVVLGRAWTVLEPRWRHDSAKLLDHEQPETDQGKTGAPSLDDLELKSLEEFVALRYLAFIRGVLGHLRHVMIFLALSFSLVLISLNVYSFEPHQSLIWSFTLIFVVTGCLVVGVLVQLHRDPILSRVTGTSGNALDIHFYLRIVAFGALPLLTLLATHFPSIGQYLVSFLRPSLEALK